MKHLLRTLLFTICVFALAFAMQTDETFAGTTQTQNADLYYHNYGNGEFFVGEDIQFVFCGSKKKNLKWKSDDTDVVTVDRNGLATCLGTGVATITAKDKKNNDTSVYYVTVIEPHMKESDICLYINAEEDDDMAYATLEGCYVESVSSSNDDVVLPLSIWNEGRNGSIRILSLEAGEATLTLTGADGNEYTCNVRSVDCKKIKSSYKKLKKYATNNGKKNYDGYDTGYLVSDSTQSSGHTISYGMLYSVSANSIRFEYLDQVDVYDYTYLSLEVLIDSPYEAKYFYKRALERTKWGEADLDFDVFDYADLAPFPFDHLPGEKKHNLGSTFTPYFNSDEVAIFKNLANEALPEYLLKWEKKYLKPCGITLKNLGFVDVSTSGTGNTVDGKNGSGNSNSGKTDSGNSNNGKNGSGSSGTGNATGTKKNSEGLFFADSDSRYLTDSEIKALTPEQRKLARNEIYARHGRMFATKSLQDYFNSCDWYVPLYSASEFNDAVLNKYEKANAEKIRSFE